MATERKTVRSLLSAKIIKELATPANGRYGQAIYKRHGVEIIKREPNAVTGWVGGLDGTSAEGGGQRRRVRLSATAKGLAWHCAGNPKDHQIFCKHCYALALAIIRSRAK